ncbi:DUF4367 domain-containing protein [Bacillus spongiae]|uniref:DUF4367 domain-containing protein n=1 Tax=Bacillus spongiae TaxID=2683610 RepID=A0ABU8HHY4_9BACI
MKKIIFLLIAVPFFLIGCGSDNDVNLVTYDNGELEKELKEEGIQPKLPTKFPIVIVEHELSIPPPPTPKGQFPVYYTGENGEYFELMIWDRPVTWEEISTYEKVDINGNESFYMSDEAYTSTLHWEDGDYYYILQYHHQSSETKITKGDLINIAESFK